jgi:O-antigen ligase
MNNLATPRLKPLLDRAMEYALYFTAMGISISNALTSIGVGAVLLVWVFKKITLREKLSAPRPLAILASVLFLAYAASLIHSEYLGQSIHALFLKYAKYLLLMLAIAEGVQERRVAVNMTLVLCLTATAICFDGFYQYFSGKDFLMFREAGRLDVFWKGLSFRSFRVTATFPAANTFASYLVPILMLGLAFSFLGAKTQKVAWGKGVCLGSMVLCLFLTFSRGGLIACLGGVLTLAFLFKKKILLIIPAVLLIVFLYGPRIYGNRSAGNGAIDPTVETRLLMLENATRLFQIHPWTGIGLNTYYKNIEKNQDPSLPPPGYAHNSYIQMLAEVGIVGFMSFMALMIYWFGRGLRAFRKSRDPELKFLLGGVLAGVSGLCVASFFDNVLFELLPATLFWVLMGYGVALARIGTENNAS